MIEFYRWMREKHHWSLETFGPGRRTEGVCRHIEKELQEVRKAPGDLVEWADVLLLALDGAMRAGFSPEEIWMALQYKQNKNMARTWPAPGPEDQPVEHDRSGE
jgi:hypothetical protein